MYHVLQRRNSQRLALRPSPDWQDVASLGTDIPMAPYQIYIKALVAQGSCKGPGRDS